MVQIRFYATFRPLVGGKAVSLPVTDGEPVGAVLRRLVAAYPALQGELLTPDGEALPPYVQVFINGRSIRDLQGLATPVTEDDQLAIFPPVAGG
jgi:molybdopterin synthase sulfur carrier subunit